MNTRKLIITWKPDVLTNVEHDGSFKTDGKDARELMIQRWEGDYSKGFTIRSERNCFRNIKTKEAAERIINRRNKKEIIVAKWNDEVIYPLVTN